MQGERYLVEKEFHASYGIDAEFNIAPVKSESGNGTAAGEPLDGTGSRVFDGVLVHEVGIQVEGSAGIRFQVGAVGIVIVILYGSEFQP